MANIAIFRVVPVALVRLSIVVIVVAYEPSALVALHVCILFGQVRVVFNTAMSPAAYIALLPAEREIRSGPAAQITEQPSEALAARCRGGRRRLYDRGCELLWLSVGVVVRCSSQDTGVGMGRVGRTGRDWLFVLVFVFFTYGRVEAPATLSRRVLE